MIAQKQQNSAMKLDFWIAVRLTLLIPPFG